MAHRSGWAVSSPFPPTATSVRRVWRSPFWRPHHSSAISVASARVAPMNTLSMTIFAFKPRNARPRRRASERTVSFLQPAPELGQHRLRSISLTPWCERLDARGRSPMCRQRTRPSLSGEAGGRSLGFISFIHSSGGFTAAETARVVGHLVSRFASAYVPRSL
jgi:hypothetical protein